MNAVLARVDVDALVERTQIGSLIARSGAGVAAKVLDVARSQGVGLDGVVLFTNSNGVARTPDEIADARTDWEERRRFGDVSGYAGPRLAAPDLARFATANAAS